MNGSNILQSKLLYWAEKKGNAPCLVEANTGEVLTYSELLYAVVAIRPYLGAESQVTVSALSGGIVDSVIWIACLIGGHMHIPISPHGTTYEFEQSIAKYAPDIILIEDEAIIGNSSRKIFTSSEVKKIITKGRVNKKPIYLDILPKDGKVLLFTSGSTSNPKGVLLSVTQMIITANNICRAHQLTEEDRGLTPLPFYHVNAPVVSLLTTILSGSSLIIAPKYSTSNFWKWVERYDPTWISLVPTMVIMLLTTKKPEFLKRSSLRFIRTASASLPRIVLERFENKFSIPLIETYGISEAASTITANPLPPKVHKPGSVGFPIGIKLRICRRDQGVLVDVQQGETGEVWIQGENVITHYENNAGSDAFLDGWFCTGDLGYFDQDNYLFLVGREKDVIIRGGENIAPREIEEVLLTYPGIQEVAVVGHPDQVYGERIVAYIVIDSKSKQVMTDQIKAHIAEKLSPQKIPADIYVLVALPRGNTGKIDKKQLRDIKT